MSLRPASLILKHNVHGRDIVDAVNLEPLGSCCPSASIPHISASVNRSEVDGKGEIEIFERGRSLARSPRPSNPLSRAHSRVRLHDASIELNAQPIEKRLSRSSTFYDDPSDTCAVLDDDILEPCPHVPLCSVAERMARHHQDPEFHYSLDLMKPFHRRLNPEEIGLHKKSGQSSLEQSRATSISNSERHEQWETEFTECKSIYRIPTLRPDTVAQFIPDMTHREYLTLRSSSSEWTKDDPTVSAVCQSDIVNHVPAEIVRQVYGFLRPYDFNAARHTCRSWYIHSLEKSLLESMLKRGGWWRSVQEHLTANHVLDSKTHFNDEWLMSKLLARECALGPEWTGNGLNSGSSSPRNLTSGIQVQPKTTPLEVTAVVDFTELGIHYPNNGTFSGTTFTVSACGKFLMVANGCLIYIYKLNCDPRDVHIPGHLKPVTSIICPRRVLSCSMDTSSNRYAIAILFDERMGLVCDLTKMNTSDGAVRFSQPPLSADMQSGSSYRISNYRNNVLINTSALQPNSHNPTEPPFTFPVIAASHRGPSQSQALRGSSWSSLAQNAIHRTALTSNAQSCFFPRSLSPPGYMPLETGPRSVYRSLCSSDDPPRSVAICPQQRCVAYGCSSGIELHWVDALTGQDLNRWFPLTAPSDYLYFLPPRRGVDSAKKLRLISSAARPGGQSGCGERFRNGKANRRWWMADSPVPGSPTGGSEIGITGGREGGIRPDGTDHYRAIPLSDGYHILFTDPTTGLLCLGSDAPIGGPTKLLRKLWFAGPKDCSSPIIYSAGAELSMGVRIAAAYASGEEVYIWLFSVPRDVFEDSQADYLTDRPLFGEGKLSAGGEWMHWWHNDGPQDWSNQSPGSSTATSSKESLWPVQVRGQEIGRCKSVVDLAVDSGPDLAIWVFGREGLASVWALKHPIEISRSTVVRDGTVRTVDDEGDVEMSDPVTMQSMEQQASETFDGSASLDASRIFSPVTASDAGNAWSAIDVSITDGDGDVLMADLDTFTRGERSDSVGDRSLETVTLNFIEQDRGIGMERWMGRSYIDSWRGHGGDLVEELNGIARIDIEIH
jgi:hypothetical protein